MSVSCKVTRTPKTSEISVQQYKIVLSRLINKTLKSMIQKFVVFWVVAPCSVVAGYQSFGAPCCLHLQGWTVVLIKGPVKQ